MSSYLATTGTAPSVLVIGSGVAGLSAASQLISHNIPTTLLERSPRPGGNSIKASSGINGAPTKYQPGPDNSFFDDTIRSAGTVLSELHYAGRRQQLISTLTGNSSAAITWLTEEKDIDLSKVAQLGAHSFPRTHRGKGQLPPGAAIVKGLLGRLEASPLFTLKTGCQVTKVLQENGNAVGVQYLYDGVAGTLHAPVIFASGGFAGDANGMLAQFRPDLKGFPSTNEPRPGSQDLLTEVGAQLLDMKLVQVHPTSFVDPKDASNPQKFLAGEILRGEGGILLRDGKRFVNEMESRKHITHVITQQKASNAEPRQWDIQIVLDESTYNATKSHVDFYLWKGLMKKTTVSESGIDALAALDEYADSISGKIADPFGRKSFGNWALKDVKPDSVVYIGTVTPAVHFTMGGVQINEKSEVLGESDKPIKGLWAAGEITGGIHGDNRLGGSSLLEGVVFGRIAGDQAAAFVQQGGEDGASHNEL